MRLRWSALLVSACVHREWPVNLTDEWLVTCHMSEGYSLTGGWNADVQLQDDGGVLLGSGAGTEVGSPVVYTIAVSGSYESGASLEMQLVADDGGNVVDALEAEAAALDLGTLEGTCTNKHGEVGQLEMVRASGAR